LRLVVASPFLDRQHGTELCIIEQIERLSVQYGWKIHLYSQRVDQVKNLSLLPSSHEGADASITLHKVSDIPGPHLVKYLWWLFANHLRRHRDRIFGAAHTDLTYSPGINCFDADAIAVHIVFHEFVSRVSPNLQMRQIRFRNWYLMIHRKLYYQLAMFLESKIYRNPRVRLIAVSSLVAKHLKTHFDRSDVSVIPNAVDATRFNPEARIAKRWVTRQFFGYSEEDFVLLLIGNDWRNKGLDPLLKAVSLLCDLPVRLLVVGNDDPRPYQQCIAKLPSHNRVRFVAPSPDVLTFYAAADAYVAPSLADAFGLPIVEAMACALPVIVSVYAGASELVHDGVTGLLLIDPRDPSEIAAHIKKLYADNLLRQKMGQAASQYLRANCDWDQNVAKTRDILEAILRERQKARRGA